MSYFPFFIDITNKPCLIVGGGIVALRKIEKLLPFDVEIIVISPAFCKEIQEMEGIHR
ncbi:MAG: bifunctional precorrin-2 dehydrogenase/sirohydrochlorin ferrochelatase, partial [Anaerotignum sp.]|nr:bifunctional precorrin-2 dehydrogenase/sirohydrochlorin ferrochelatase [Anaerotignum sp.]